MAKLPLVLVADNIRSAYNVGSLFRTADGAGIEKLVLCGICPHPRAENDKRPPYVIERAERAIAKTALGAEKTTQFEYFADVGEAVAKLKNEGRMIYALEQSKDSTNLFQAKLKFPAALVIGQELGGVDKSILDSCDAILEIPMFGQKDSLNVSSAAAVVLFWLRSQYWFLPLQSNF